MTNIFNIKKQAQVSSTGQIEEIKNKMQILIGSLNSGTSPEERNQIAEQWKQNALLLQNIDQLAFRQSEEMGDIQNQISTGNPNVNALQNTGNIGQISMIKNKTKKKAFNLKKAQEAFSPMDPMGLNDSPELMGDGIEGMEGENFSTGIEGLKDGADLKDKLDAMDYRNARNELLNYIEEPDQQQIIEDALSTFYQEGLESNQKLGIAIKIFDMLPTMLKVIDPNDETFISAPFTSAEVDEEIKKLAKKYSKKEIKSYNLTKTAQHKTLENAIVWNTNTPRLDPFLRQPVSDWHIMERNKGFGLVVDDVWNIDWESIWRGNIMDKYSRPYRDKEGNWVGGYLNKRFETDRNIPEINNYQLKPGQRRRPILPEYGNTEARLEAAREKGEIEGGPVVEGKPFNWKEAQFELIRQKRDLKIEDPARWHQLQIAKKTLNMSDAMVNVLGGMTKEQARRVIEEYENSKKKS